MKLSPISSQLPSRLNPLLLPESRGPASPRGAPGAPEPAAPRPAPAAPPCRCGAAPRPRLSRGAGSAAGRRGRAAGGARRGAGRWPGSRCARRGGAPRRGGARREVCFCLAGWAVRRSWATEPACRGRRQPRLTPSLDSLPLRGSLSLAASRMEEQPTYLLVGSCSSLSRKSSLG